MKATLTFLSLCLVLLFVSCKKLKEIDDGSPHIKSISFAGIPAKNVMIDQRTRTITVQVPSILPDGGLVPKFELSTNTVVREGLTSGGKIPLSPFCKCIPSGGIRQESHLLVSLDTTAPGYPPTTTYRIVLSPPEGCLEPIADSPITYSKTPVIDDPQFIRIYLPVKNLYRNPYIRAYFLKNLETGQEHSLYTSIAGFCLNSCDDESANRLTFPYNNNPAHKSYLRPGEYQVSILASCDTNRIFFPQPFIFNR